MNSYLFFKGGPFRNHLDLPLPVLVPCGLVDPCLTGVGPWLICGFSWTIGELFVGSLLDRIGFLGYFIIGFSIGIFCVIAVL